MKALKYIGLAALVAGISCSSNIGSKPKKGEYINQNSVCSINLIGYCTPNQMMYADSKSVKELTPETFDSVVLENKLPVVVKFYAEWCGPCRAYKPIFEKVCAEYEENLVCAAYNTDQDNEIENSISGRYDVTGIPSTRFFHKGSEFDKKRFSGGRPELILRSMFDAFLKECGN
ncbi:MAG: thioredoxin domain-containing protein [Nanoarchaeota archaeon]